MPIYPDGSTSGGGGPDPFASWLRPRGGQTPPGSGVQPFLDFDPANAEREGILGQFDLNRQKSSDLAAQKVFQVQEQAQREVNRLMVAGETGTDEFNRLAHIAQTGQTQRGPSFWDRLLGVVDKPGQLGRMAAHNIISTLQGETPEFDFSDGFLALMGRTEAVAALHGEDAGEDGRVSGSVLLDQLGWQRTEGLPQSTGRFFAHFAAEVLTDPLSYVTFGAAGLSKTFVLKTFQGMADDAGRSVARELGESVLRRAPYQSDSAVKTMIGKPIQADIDSIIDDVVTQARKIDGGYATIDDLDPRYGEYLGIDGDALLGHIERLAAKPIDEAETVVRKALAQDHVLRRAVGDSMETIVDEVAPAITARDWAHKSLGIWQADNVYSHAAFSGGIKFGIPFLGMDKAVSKTLTKATSDPTKGLGRSITRKLFGSNPEYVYSTGERGLIPVARWMNTGVGKPLTEKWLDFASKWNNSGYISSITRGRMTASSVRAVEQAGLDAARKVNVVATRDRLIDSVRRMMLAGEQQGLSDEELLKGWRVVADSLERSGGDPEVAMVRIADGIAGIDGGDFSPSDDMGEAIMDFVGSWSAAQKNSIDVVRAAGIEMDGIENYMPHLLEGDMRKWIDQAINSGMEFDHQGNLGDQILAALAHNVDGNSVRFEGDLVGSAQFLNTRLIGKTVAAGEGLPIMLGLIGDTQILNRHALESFGLDTMTAGELNDMIRQAMKDAATNPANQGKNINLPKDMDNFFAYNADPLRSINTYLTDLEHMAIEASMVRAARESGIFESGVKYVNTQRFAERVIAQFGEKSDAGQRMLATIKEIDLAHARRRLELRMAQKVEMVEVVIGGDIKIKLPKDVIERRGRIAALLAKKELSDADIEAAVIHATELGRSTYKSLRNAGHTNDAAQMLASQEMLKEVDEILKEVGTEYKAQFHQEIKSWMEFFATSTAEQRRSVKELADANNLAQHEVVDSIIRDRERLALEFVKVEQAAGVDMLTGQDLEVIADMIDASNRPTIQRLEKLLHGVVSPELNTEDQAFLMEQVSEFIRAASDLDWMNAEDIADRLRQQARLIDEHARFLDDGEEDHIRWAAQYVNTRFGHVKGSKIYSDSWDLIPYVDDGSEIYIYHGTSAGNPVAVLDSIGQGGMSLFPTRAAGYSEAGANPYVAVWKLSDLPQEIQDHFRYFMDYKSMDNSPGFKPLRVGAQGSYINWSPDIETGIETRSLMGNLGELPAPEAVIDTHAFRQAIENVALGAADVDGDEAVMNALQSIDKALLVQDINPVKVMRDHGLGDGDADAFFSDIADAASYIARNNSMTDIRRAAAADDINMVVHQYDLVDTYEIVRNEQALIAVNSRLNNILAKEQQLIGQAAHRKERFLAGGDALQRDMRDSPLYEDVLAGWRVDWLGKMASPEDVRYHPGTPGTASWAWRDGMYLGQHGEMKYGPGYNRGHTSALEMDVLANPNNDLGEEIIEAVARGESVPIEKIKQRFRSNRAWGEDYSEEAILAQPRVRTILQEQSWGSLVRRGLAENAEPDTEIIVFITPGGKLGKYEHLNLAPSGTNQHPVYVRLGDVQIDNGIFDSLNHTVYARTGGIHREATDVVTRPLMQKPGAGQLARMKGNKLTREYVGTLFPDAATGDQAFDDLAARFSGLSGSMEASNERQIIHLMEMLAGNPEKPGIPYDVGISFGGKSRAFFEGGGIFGHVEARDSATRILRGLYSPEAASIRVAVHKPSVRTRIARIIRIESGREVEWVQAKYSPEKAALVTDGEGAESIWIPVLKRPGESPVLTPTEFEKFLARTGESAADLRLKVENGEFVSDDPRVLNTLLNVSDELSVEFDELAERVDYLSALKGQPVVNREAALGAKRSRRIGSDTLGDSIKEDIASVKAMTGGDVHMLINPRDGRKLAPRGHVVGIGGEQEVLNIESHARLGTEIAAYVRRNGGMMDRSRSYLLVESVGDGYRVSVVTPSANAKEAELSALSFGSESYFNLRTGEKVPVQVKPRGVGDLSQQEQGVAELRKIEGMLRGNNIDGAWHQMQTPETRRLLRTIISDAELDAVTETAEVAFYSSPKRRPLLIQEELMKANRALRKELGKRDTAVEQLSELSTNYAGLELAAVEEAEHEYHAWLGEFIDIMSDVLNVGRAPDGQLNAAGLYPRDSAGKVSREATADFVTRVKEAEKLAGDLGFDDWENALHAALNDIPYDVRLKEAGSRLPVRVFGVDGKVIDYDFADKWDVQMIRNFMRSWQALNTPVGIDLLQKEMGYVARAWKSMATVSRPTFHVRNLTGGVWNNQIADVHLSNYHRINTNMMKLRRLTQEMPFDEAIDQFPKDIQDLMFHLHDQRILDLGFTASEFERLSAPVKSQWKRLSPGHAEFIPTRMGAVGMRTIEDFLRASAFDRWYREIGPEAAAQVVWDIHFDYTDVGQLDRQIKKFVPFWIWTKNNIPLQLRVLMERPGLISRYKHLMTAFDESFGGEGDLSQWPNNPYNTPEAADTGIVLNADTPFWAKLIFEPDLPVTDLQVFGNPLSIDTWMNGLANTLNPIVTEPVSFQQQNEWGSTQAPLGLNEILRITNFAGLTDNVEQGDRVQVGYGTKNAYLTAFPIINEYANLTTLQSSPEGRQKLGLVDTEGVTAADRARAALLTMGRGIGFQAVTPNAARSESAIARQEVYDIVDELRARGVLQPTDFDYNLGPDELESILSELYGE